MEREGSGFDLIYDRLLSQGRPAPVPEEGVDWVKVTIQRRIVRAAVLRLLSDADERFQLTQREKWPSLFEQQNGIYKWKLCGLKKWNRERVVHGAWLWTTRWPYTQSLKRVVRNCEAHGGQPGTCCGHHAARRIAGSSFA